jgi:cytoskeletal protein CcmA (bactofilin family)
MFNSKPQEVREIKEVETIIGPSVKVRGDFHGSGNIVVEGAVEGSLVSDKTISIKSKAKVIANIEANDAIIGGDVEGNIKAKGYLEITGTAIINGDIEASSLSIAQGAVFNGSCIMTKKRNSEHHNHQGEEKID